MHIPRTIKASPFPELNFKCEKIDVVELLTFRMRLEKRIVLASKDLILKIVSKCGSYVKIKNISRMNVNQGKKTCRIVFQVDTFETEISSKVHRKTRRKES